MARTLIYAATYPRYQNWCWQHDVAPLGQLVRWVHDAKDLQGYLDQPILLVDPPTGEFLDGIIARRLEIVEELPMREVRPGLFLEPVERDCFEIEVGRFGPFWHARCTGTRQFDWPANPGRLGFTREHAIARATKQARKASGEFRRGEGIQIPRG